MNHHHRPRHLATALAACLATLSLGALCPMPPLDGRMHPVALSTPAPASHTAGEPGRAREELAELTVHPADTGVHYQRTDWGIWTRHDGCTTREFVLRRDAQPGTVRLGPSCRVLAGRWVSPYDQALITNPALVQIDHRVPVKEAAQSGTRTWTRTQRERFYNDPANLVAVDAHANTAKGDRDPATWRPANHADWCTYATSYIDTKHTYRLTVDPAEHAALTTMLTTCAGAQ